jgi:hypothetical protein
MEKIKSMVIGTLIRKSCEIQITLYPKFTGKDNGKNLEILYVRRPTADLFPIPDYLSGLYWVLRGDLANSITSF